MKRLLREPLLHFLLLGAALFLWYEWRGGGGGPGSTRIVLGAGQIEYLVAGFTRTWQRPPTEPELKGLLDDWVPRGDRQPRGDGDGARPRRHRHPPTPAAEARVPARGRRRCGCADRGRARCLAREPRRGLCPRAGGRAAPGLRQRRTARRRRPRPKPAACSPRSGGEGPVRRSTTWATLRCCRSSSISHRPTRSPACSAKSSPGRSPRRRSERGAVRCVSSFGLHLVFVTERREARQPTLAEVRPQVERDAVGAARRDQLAHLYDSLLAKYTVVIEPRPAEGPAKAAPP